MGLIDALNKLDARVLPRLASGFARIARAVAGLRVRPLTLAAGLLALAVAATVAWRLGEPKSEPGSGPHYRVGVAAGIEIDKYVADSRSQLQRLAVGARAADPVYALVSFSSYLNADSVATLAAAAGPQLVTIAAYARLPLPRLQTEIIRLAAQRLPADLRASLARVAEQATTDSLRYAERARGQEKADVRKVLEDNAAIDAAEAAAFGNPACVCIFALVVQGPPAVLNRLAAQDGVRVVDPAPEVTMITSNTTFVALLPEQSGWVEPPPDDSLNGTGAVPLVTNGPSPSAGR
jgi:hypothetical protein